MTWQLRRANEGDLEPIMELERTVFGLDAWSAETMRSELGGPHTYYLVAFRPGHPERLDGYAGLRAPRGIEQADIQTIAVAEHARRSGLGRVLMLSLIAEARQRGATEVFLEVRADNPPARSLYDTLGFEQLGVREAYYQPEGVDAIVMRLRVPPSETRPA